MENNEGGLELYEKKFETLKEQLFNRKSHNLRTFVIRSLINCGIGLDYALPFIIATFIIGCASFDDENVPFIRDEIVDYASVEMIDTSLGFHSEKVSYDYDYDDQFEIARKAFIDKYIDNEKLKDISEEIEEI